MKMLSLKKTGLFLVLATLTAMQLFAGPKQEAKTAIHAYVDDLNVILLQRNPRVTPFSSLNPDLIIAYGRDLGASTRQLLIALGRLGGDGNAQVDVAFNNFSNIAQLLAMRGVIIEDESALIAAADKIIEQLHRLAPNKIGKREVRPFITKLQQQITQIINNEVQGEFAKAVSLYNAEKENMQNLIEFLIEQLE
jgi:hypothetical protein